MPGWAVLDGDTERVIARGLLYCEANELADDLIADDVFAVVVPSEECA